MTPGTGHSRRISQAPASCGASPATPSGPPTLPQMGRRSRRRARQEQLRIGAHGTGDRFGPLGEAWRLDGPIAELLALHEAETPAALQRVLLIPGRRTDTLPDDGVAAFVRAHRVDHEGIVESAVLACTNHRWTGIARSLLESLVGAGLLDEGHTSQLVELLLEADGVAVTAPGRWLADFYLQRRDGRLQPLDLRESYTLHRPVAPQLRRWAAGRAAGDGDGVGRVLPHVAQMDSRNGAAAVLGLLDTVDHHDEATAAELLGVALGWPNPAVRLTALKRLAATGRQPEALERAAGDRAANVRRWAARNRQATLITATGSPDPALVDTDTDTADAGRPAEVLQPALFG